MATPPSTSSKSTKKTSAKSSAARAESSAACAPSSKPPPPAREPESTSTSSNSASDSVGAAQQADTADQDSPSPPEGSSLSAEGEARSPPTRTPEFLVVAQVLGAHGIRGELKCRIITDFPSRRFKRGTTVIVRGQPLVIQAARIQGATVLLKLEDINDRDVAEALRGADVEVPTDAAIKLP